ncbi:MAG: hypothetical protein D5R96_04090 [Methanocalculus sp. MSAO_Arc2]|uniref:hypothetical protein n=1 Tax=Methanocalculus sp. MSAO_Arc2 TaxID=2293855 RepID=UPI000FF5D881|nr:MAG: hypothetical protein D5R96_04090 [Methanocalculus sp. MSAO_Arc2]
MKRSHLQLTAAASGLLLAAVSAGTYLGYIQIPVAAVLSILLIPVFLIPVGLLLAADITDGDIPFMGY